MKQKYIRISRTNKSNAEDIKIALVALCKYKVMSYNRFGNSIGILNEPAFIYGYNSEKIVLQTLNINEDQDFFELRNHQLTILEKIPVDEINISELLGEAFDENPLYIFDEPSEENYQTCLTEIKSDREKSSLIIEQLCHQHNALILKIAKTYKIPFQVLQDSFSKNSFIQQIFSSLRKRINIDIEHDSRSLLEIGNWIIRQEIIRLKNGHTL
ncbi:MAG: hypothetical protein HYU67_12895 [Flavobacteriia bacterium]|nr:hypothetical protein [Flavobacteriia bacterium]